jgi:tetratricopeptide (TPR) repeat protein
LHDLVSGEYLPAWRYASVAAKRAQGAYAHVEAAGLYGRALEAGRRLSEVDDKELAAVYEAQAESWRAAAEFEKSYGAFAAARRLLATDAQGQARLLLKSSNLEERLGRYRQALRLATRARKMVDGMDGPEAARIAAETSAWYATVLQIEGRTEDAVKWAKKTVQEADAADDAEALGSAYFVLGWASVMRGKEDAEPMFQRSLDAYRRSGNLIRQAVQLTNLGAVCCLEGRWDEAITYYEAGREASLKLGDTINAALARMNVSEILIDRGEFAQAEELLLDILPTWKAAKYRYYLGFCLSLLGRLSLRTGRLDQALEELEQAKANYLEVGAGREIPALDARLAECRLCRGDVDGAFKVVTGMLSRGDADSRANPLALLHRVHALALSRKGDSDDARSALEAGIAAARNARDLFELTLGLLALVELDRQGGDEPAPDVMAEIRSLMARLKIRTVPAALIAPQAL